MARPAAPALRGPAGRGRAPAQIEHALTAGGRTADAAFFDLLIRDWEPIEVLARPNWPGTHDRLTVYRRRPAGAQGMIGMP
jgi:hypothetical protein